MSMTYRLHYAPDNASLIVRLALLEMGVPFEDILVDRRKQEQSSEDYLRINPAGLIPALETDQGTLFETGAILLWLSEQHNALAPAPSSEERPDFLKWLFYISNTLHPNLRMHFYPGKYIKAGQETALRDGCRANLTKSLTLLEAEAGQGHSWFNSASPSVADIYLAACLRWMDLYTNRDRPWFTLSDWPNLTTLCKKLDRRASVLAASPIEGFAPNPFSNPQPVTPLAGAAV